MNVLIYTLSDPRTGEVRYVGKTCKTLAQRLANHIYDAPRIPSHRGNWIIQLSRLDLRPSIALIDIIEDSDDNDWQAREVYWIAHYRRIGARLTNLDSGGRRGKCMTPESKEKCRIASTGRKHSAETREKMGKIFKGRKMLPEWLERQRESRIRNGKVASPELRETRRINRLGKKHSEETIRKIKMALTGQKRTPEQCARISAGKKASFALSK